MARSRWQGFAEQGGHTVSVAGFTSTTNVEQSFPGCSVTVYLPGTTTLATIYSDNAGTAKANPFTSDANSFWFFYSDLTSVDVKFSGTGITTPFTLPSLAASGGGTSTVGVITVTDSPYLAKGDGTTDDTASIIAAFAAVPAGGANVRFPTGTYLVGGSGAIFTITKDYTHIVCDEGVTFKLVPTATAAVFRVSNSFVSGFPVYGFSIEGAPRFTSTDTTFTKTMIELVDVSGAYVSLPKSTDGAWHDVGLTSIGIHTFGRDVSHIDSSGAISADRPIVVSDNPNSGIDLDFWTLGGDRDLVLIANGHPNIEIGDCYVSNSAFRNISCNKGTNGLVFAGSVNPSASTNNSIDNLRFEQGTDAAGYAVDWRAAISTNLTVRQCAAGTPGRGYKFRQVTHLEVRQCSYNLGGGVALDFTTCDQVDLVNNFFQSTTTFVTTGLKRIKTESQFGAAPAPGAPFERWFSNANANAAASPLSLLDESRATLGAGGTTIPANNASTISVPGLGGNAVYGKFLLLISGAGDGAAEFAFTTTALYPVGGAANLPANIVVGVPAANHVGVVFNSAGNITIFNNYAALVTARIVATYFL